MSREELSAGVALIKLFQSYDGRDRMTRVVQYAARFVVGCTTGSSKPAAEEIRIFAARLLTSVAFARRTFRFGKDVPAMLHLGRYWSDDSTDDALTQSLEISQTTFLLAFLFVDHIAFFQQVRYGLRGGAKSIRLSFGFLALSCFMSVLSGLKKLMSLSYGKYEESEQPLIKQKRKDCIFRIVRNFFMTVQMAHVADFFVTHNILVGLLGMTSSTMDITQAWPEWKVFLRSDRTLPSWRELLELIEFGLAPENSSRSNRRRSLNPSDVGWGPFWGCDDEPTMRLGPRTRSMHTRMLDYLRSD
eukprot:TRINITY_DN100437_c0_g1_i1.p1 TRINITY_DN100437_c0_g1~~TRINITY_DN100437_c0_g1_i1.p1  ORF type:complete len:302 (-),score=28.62 TRINITY_DN100437_c0_g1_i1:103-1008(-)